MPASPRMTPRQARRLACSAAGTTVCATALVSPLHDVAEALFSAHMVQHLLLVAVAAPLLALGSFAPALRRLPPAARAWLGRTARRLRLHTWRTALLGPAAVAAIWTAHVGVLWMWHVPALYQIALQRPALHALEHASMLVTAWAFWAVALVPGRRPALGLAGVLLYLFAAAGQGTVLGALLTLAERPWYPAHARPTAALGVALLEDQQLAGVIMWVIGGLAYVTPALAIVWRALQDEERSVARG